LEATEELRRDFKLLAQEKLTRMTRVRMARKRPLAFVYSYVPGRFTEKLSARAMLKLPLSSVIENTGGLKITDVRHLVGAKLADDEVSAHLERRAPPSCSSKETIFAKRTWCCALSVFIVAICFVTN
jgi:DNA-binding GntR family transcriptional regulator